MNPGTAISGEAATEAAAAVLGRLFGARSLYEREERHADATMVLAAVVPLVEARLREELANQIETAAAAHTPSSSYREGLIDGHHRAARVVRGTEATE